MNHLQTFTYRSAPIRTVQRSGEPWFVLKDVCEVLGLGSPHKVFDRLDEDEKGRSSIPTLGGKQEMTCINESGLYSVILRSDKPEAKPFRKWVTSEVLPTIRKTGGYVNNDELFIETYLPNADEATRALFQSTLKTVRDLNAKIEHQRQIIMDYEPKVDYLDKILESTGTMATTQIAADYDISARQLNKILHEQGIQHKVNGQWILYRKHMGMGYTKSKTISFYRNDGTLDNKPQTQWTQKGRLMIHEILSSMGIKAAQDK